MRHDKQPHPVRSLALAAVLGSLVLAGVRLASGGEEPPVSVDREIVALSDAPCAERYRVRLLVEGVRPDIPVDVMLVFDRSGSMADGGEGCTLPEYGNEGDCVANGGVWGPQPLTSAQEGAKLFIDLLRPDDRVGVASYGTGSTLDEPLTLDHEAVKDTIDTFEAQGRTNMADAIQRARNELDTNGRPAALEIMIVFSDGVANRSTPCGGPCSLAPCAPTCCTEDAIAQAGSAKDLGILVFGIILNNIAFADEGCTIDEVVQFAKETMLSVSSGPDFFFDPETPGELAGIFEVIASQAVTVATDLTVTDVVAPEFRIVPGSADPPATVEGEDTLVWSFDSLGEELRVFEYEIERASGFTPPGVYPTSVESALEYTDHEGVDRVLEFPVREALVRGELCEDCTGQGRAALLVKKRREIGSELKFKLAGPPHGKYKLFADHGRGPVIVEDVGRFCLDFGSEAEMIDTGKLNQRGFRSLFWGIPDDPELVGETLAFQMAALDPEAPGGVAISNAVSLVVAAEGEGAPCEGGVRRMEYWTVVPYDGTFPATVTTRVFPTHDRPDPIGEVTFLFDPADPPDFPLATSDEGLIVTKAEAFPGYFLVQSLLRACALPDRRLPDATTFETSVGETTVSRDLDTSCATPLGFGFNFHPLFLESVQDVASAPPGDCE